MIEKQKKKQNSEIILILDNLRSVQNTASFFRLADCIGVSKIYCIGTTPTPYDRFKRLRNDFIKISLGSETLLHEHLPTLSELFPLLKKDNYQCIGIEQDITSIDYKNFTASKKSCIILSNEPYGMEPETRNICDVLLEIPQYGEKESLNVFSAGSIILYRLFDK